MTRLIFNLKQPRPHAATSIYPGAQCRGASPSQESLCHVAFVLRVTHPFRLRRSFLRAARYLNRSFDALSGQGGGDLPGEENARYPSRRYRLTAGEPVGGASRGRTKRLGKSNLVKFADNENSN